MEWKPASVEDVKRIVDAGLVECDRGQAAAFQTYRVEPYLAPIIRCGKLEQVVVVAPKGNSVIYWEDIEEGFGISAVRADGTVLEQDCGQNDLRLALNQWIGRRS